MSMLFRRILHPVGQGAFFTEQILSTSNGNVLCNVIYDCGSISKNVSHKIEREIDNMYANKRPVDILFLSHFDYDHIKYVYYLQSQGYLAKAKVFIPLLFEEKFLSFSSAYKKYKAFIKKMNKDNIKTILVKIDEGDMIDREINIEEEISNEIDSGIKLKFEKDNVLWYWVPFNIKYKERIDDFGAKLKSEKIELDEVLNNTDYEYNKETLKRIYQSMSKDQDCGNGTSINFNSLQMMSYPASKDMCAKYAKISICDSYFFDSIRWNSGYIRYKFQKKEHLYPGSCLYTGDTSSNSSYVWNTWMKKIDFYLKAHLVLFQIPHHGSKHGNNERIANEDRIYAAFTNFAPNYKQIYDPNINLLFYLKRKPLILVTNDDSFRFEECWTLKR